MGRHRRSAAGRAEPAGPAVEITPDAETTREYGAPPAEAAGPDAAPYAAGPPPRGHGASWERDAALFDGGPHASRTGRAVSPGSHEHLSPDGLGTRSEGRRRRKRGGAPVRTGLLGVSAAVALGAVAVGTGLVPGAGQFGGGHDAKVRAADSPADPGERGVSAGSPERGTPSASRGAQRSAPPSATPSKSAGAKGEKTKATPSVTPSVRTATGQGTAGRTSGRDSAGSAGRAGTPHKGATPAQKAPPRTTAAQQPPAGAAQSSGSESAAASAVLSLVNQERTKAGCGPVQADRKLAALAAGFSQDMAARDFFDHTDPDGDTPWDRADDAGIDNLGGENIARGQADAAAVMESWMNSPGHRANILNCDYKTLGVGVHFGSGGPWWTQDFGF